MLQCTVTPCTQPRFAIKCTSDSAAMATAKTKTRMVKRFACPSSSAPSDAMQFPEETDARKNSRSKSLAKACRQRTQLLPMMPYY